jgi:hypothetical protein
MSNKLASHFVALHKTPFLTGRGMLSGVSFVYRPHNLAVISVVMTCRAEHGKEYPD